MADKKKSSTEFKASKLATQQISKDFRLESSFETAFSEWIKISLDMENYIEESVVKTILQLSRLFEV